MADILVTVISNIFSHDLSDNKNQRPHRNGSYYQGISMGDYYFRISFNLGQQSDYLHQHDLIVSVSDDDLVGKGENTAIQ